jgi:hypothetical protein
MMTKRIGMTYDLIKYFWFPAICLLVLIASGGYIVLEWIAHHFGEVEIDVTHIRRMK